MGGNSSYSNTMRNKSQTPELIQTLVGDTSAICKYASRKGTTKRENRHINLFRAPTSHGFPNNTETQEGLAVFSEFMSNSLTIKRLKILAYRVLAVDSLAKGYSFQQTFRMLKNYGMKNDDAFTVSVRVHRGGGFTKDYLYLTGLKKIYNHHKIGNNLNPLLTGKVTLEYKDSIEYLINNGFAKPSKFITDSYTSNSNKNDKIAFILENLK